MPADYRLTRLRRKRADGSTYRCWQINWSDDRGPHRVSLGTDDRPTAEAGARALWAQQNLAATDNVGVIMQAFLDATADQSGNKRDRESWRAAAPFWRDVRPGLVDAAMCQSYALWRDRAANTVRNEISAVRRGLKWAKIKPPTLWMPVSPESTVEHLTKPKFRKFLAGARAPHAKLFIQLALATGGRSTAIKQLKWERVDLDRLRIDLNPKGRTQVANKRRAVVPINKQLEALLREAKDAATTEYVIEYKGGPVGKVQTAFAAASERSGIYCTPHMLRHSAAVWMAEARTPMEEIAAYLGHKNTMITTSVYAKYNPDYLQRAAEALAW